MLPLSSPTELQIAFHPQTPIISQDSGFLSRSPVLWEHSPTPHLSLMAGGTLLDLAA